MKQRVYNWFSKFGIDLHILLNRTFGMGWYLKDKRELARQRGLDTQFPFGNDYPVLYDRSESAGTMAGQYFHTDLLVAQRIFANNPQKHVDIGSRTDGFVAHVAAFREIEMFDIRKLESKTNNISVRQADLMQLDESLINYCDSLSSLSVIEHFGLGRYGDPIDYNGHVKALDNIYKILKKGGRFYFSVPIGPQRIEFNAHRIFSLRYLIDLFTDKYTIENFSFVDDNGDLHEHVALTDELIDDNAGCRFGCCILELRKI